MDGDMASLDVSQLLVSTTSLRTALEYQQANGGALDPETRDGLYSEIVAWVNVLEDVNILRVPRGEDAGRRLVDEGHAYCGRYAAALGGITHHLDLAATTMDPEMSFWAVRELATHRYSLQGQRVEFERWVGDVKASAGTETRKVHFGVPEGQSNPQSGGNMQGNPQAQHPNSWSDPGYPQDGSASFQTQDGTWFQPGGGYQVQDPSQAGGWNQPRYGNYAQCGLHGQQGVNPFQSGSFSQYENYSQNEGHAQNASVEPNDQDSNAFLPEDDQSKGPIPAQDTVPMQESTSIQDTDLIPDAAHTQDATPIQENTTDQDGNVLNTTDVPETAGSPEQKALHAKMAEKLKTIEIAMETMALHLNTLSTLDISSSELSQSRELLEKAAEQSRKDLREFSDDFAKFQLPAQQENGLIPENDNTREPSALVQTPAEVIPEKSETMNDGTQTEEPAPTPEPEVNQDPSQYVDAVTAYEIPAGATIEKPEMIDNSTQTEEATPEPKNSSTEQQDVPEFQDAVVINMDSEGMPTFETGGTYDFGYDDSRPPSVANDGYFEENAETREDGTRIVEFFQASELNEGEDQSPRVFDDFYAVVVDEPPVEIQVKPEPEMAANGTQTVEDTLESQLDENLKRDKEVFNFMYPPVEALDGELKPAESNLPAAEVKPTPEAPTPAPIPSPSPAPSSAVTPASTESKSVPITRPPSYIGLDSTSKAIIEKDTRHITKVFNKIVAGGFSKLGLNLGVVNVEGEDWVPQFCEDHRFLNGIIMAITQPKRIFLWNVRNFPVDSDSWAKGSLVRTMSIVTDSPRYLHSFPFRHRRNVRPEAPKLLLHWNINNFSEKAISARFKDLIQAGGQLQQKIGSFSYKQMVVCITIPWTICKAQVNGENSEDQQKALEFLGRMGILTSIPVEGRIGNEVREGAWCPSSIKVGGSEQSVHGFLQETTYSGSPEMEPQMPSTPTRFVVVTMRKGESSDWVDAVHCSLGMNYHSMRYPILTNEAIDYGQLRKYYRSSTGTPSATPSASKTE